MKKLFLFSMMCLMALPLFIGCGKDSNSTNSNSDTPTTPKHNVELVYDANLVGVELSRIQDSLANSNVDSIFMVPDHYN